MRKNRFWVKGVVAAALLAAAAAAVTLSMTACGSTPQKTEQAAGQSRDILLEMDQFEVDFRAKGGHDKSELRMMMIKKFGAEAVALWEEDRKRDSLTPRK